MYLQSFVLGLHQKLNLKMLRKNSRLILHFFEIFNAFFKAF